MKLSTLGVPLLCAFITACAPSVSIQKADQSQEAIVMSPPADQVPFALRSTDLYIIPSSASSSTASAGTAGNIKLTDACQSAPKLTSKTPSATPKFDRTKPPPPVKWQKCLDAIQMVPTPARDDVYIATAGGNTTLSVSSIDTDPLLLKSVTIGQAHTASDTIGTMSADIAAGVAMGNPVSIGIGSAAALYALSQATVVPATYAELSSNTKLGNLFESKEQREKDYLENPLWEYPGQRLQARQETILCPGSTVGYDLYSYRYEDPLQLILPVTAPVNVQEAKITNTDKERCWKPLPGIVDSEKTPVRALWFYRVVAADPDPSDTEAAAIEFPPTLKRDTKDDHHGTITSVKDFLKSSPSPNQFPTSACRLVEVDVVFWQELDKIDDQSKDPPRYAKYTMTVADPNFLQVVNVKDQKNEVINFKSVCGAYISNTTAPTSTTDLPSAIIQGAQTVKKSEPSSASKKSTSAN